MVKKGNSSKKRQERLVLFVSAVVIAASILIALYVSGVFDSDAIAVREGYNNITFSNAVATCDKETRRDNADFLKGIALDDHSNRFDQSSNLYKIFFTIQLKSGDNQHVLNNYFVNCYVSASNGAITSYEVYEDKDSPAKAIRKDNNSLFGWPRD